MKSVFASTSFYYRDPFPRCYPTYLITDEKPTTVVSLNGSGGMVSHLPQDLTLWQNVIRRLETQRNRIGSLCSSGGSMLSGIMHSEFMGLTKRNNYTSTVNPLQAR